MDYDEGNIHEKKEHLEGGDFHKTEIVNSQKEFYYQENPKPKKKRRLNLAILVTALISALLGGVLASYILPVYVFGNLIPYPENYFGQDVKQVINVEPSNSEFLVSAVAKKAMPSVVGITTESIKQDFFFGTSKSQGVGTGVVVDSRGYILTNSHVVNNGSVENLKVLFEDGTTKPAKILWNDAAMDLAVIKVDGVNVTPAELGDSDQMEVGEVAIAIGNPLGLQFERTVTSGIISGLNRSIEINVNESIEGLIQTDASINPGNSGGPLLNSKGEVIGINTAKIQTGEGLGFAIPINIAKPIVDQFIENGEFSKVYMGIKGTNVDVFERSVGTDLSVDKGIYVIEVTKDSPASKADIRSGDVIVSAEGKEITSMSQLIRQLYQYKPDESIEIEIVRNGEKMKIDVKLEKTPSN